METVLNRSHVIYVPSYACAMFCCYRSLYSLLNCQNHIQNYILQYYYYMFSLSLISPACRVPPQKRTWSLECSGTRIVCVHQIVQEKNPVGQQQPGGGAPGPGPDHELPGPGQPEHAHRSQHGRHQAGVVTTWVEEEEEEKEESEQIS